VAFLCDRAFDPVKIRPPQRAEAVFIAPEKAVMENDGSFHTSVAPFKCSAFIF
jgi:hypothetical protein